MHTVFYVIHTNNRQISSTFTGGYCEIQPDSNSYCGNNPLSFVDRWGLRAEGQAYPKKGRSISIEDEDLEIGTLDIVGGDYEGTYDYTKIVTNAPDDPIDSIQLRIMDVLGVVSDMLPIIGQTGVEGYTAGGIMFNGLYDDTTLFSSSDLKKYSVKNALWKIGEVCIVACYVNFGRFGMFLSGTTNGVYMIGGSHRMELWHSESTNGGGGFTPINNDTKALIDYIHGR